MATPPGAPMREGISHKRTGGIRGVHAPANKAAMADRLGRDLDSESWVRASHGAKQINEGMCGVMRSFDSKGGPARTILEQNELKPATVLKENVPKGKGHQKQIYNYSESCRLARCLEWVSVRIT